MRLALRRHPGLDLGPRGRRALELARDEAARTGSQSVGLEHLLLGCLRAVTGAPAALLEDAGMSVDAMRADLANGAAAPRLDADALATIGIDLDEVRRHVEERFGPGALERTRTGAYRLPLTPASNRALTVAAREARDRGRDCAEPEHVLLALLRDDGRGPASILRNYGLQPAHLRAAVLDELGER
jgi:ATP-dependent Clp protease ATP-binding subunit ClpA